MRHDGLAGSPHWGQDSDAIAIIVVRPTFPWARFDLRTGGGKANLNAVHLH
jgi:hypothetical protein